MNETSAGAAPAKPPMTALVLGAIGVVFGDIGTSPLYALKECFHAKHGAAVLPENILGILSLIFWAIFIVVTAKYVLLIMRADNKGQGGILALLALVLRLTAQHPRASAILGVLGLFGATLFYGDAVITPAISVLSAVEGLEIVAPALERFVVPLSLLVLGVLFFFQRAGTASVGRVFGPVTLLWFLTLAVLGINSIAQNPAVLFAINPLYAWRFIELQPLIAFITLGAVVLAVTGTEALYADMGHFGRPAIRLAWLYVVWPCLILNYFGQGALLLRAPEAVENPFYLLAPQWFLVPLVILATAATVIASQATITGAFSLTRQAIQLGYVPRMHIVQTSNREIGQIYVPLVNWMLLIGVVFLVLQFQSSSNLAAAYGIAVTGAMMVDSLLVAVVMALAWRWYKPIVVMLAGMFFVVDLAFLSANSLKIGSGGWLPLVIAGALFAMLSTWRRGRELLGERLRTDTVSLDVFISAMAPGLQRVPGTAIFMNSAARVIPSALLHNLNHNKVLHERVVFMTIKTADVPYVPRAQRVEIADLGSNFFCVEVTYGFMQTPNVPRALVICTRQGLAFDMMQTTFFVGRESIIPSIRPSMALWRDHLFAWMMRNAGSATDFFHIPPNRVVELGTQLEF